MCTTVVSRNHRLVSLVTSCIPNLKFDRLSVDGQCPKSKINSYRAYVAFIERVIGKAQQKAGFSHAGISN